MNKVMEKEREVVICIYIYTIDLLTKHKNVSTKMKTQSFYYYMKYKNVNSI